MLNSPGEEVAAPPAAKEKEKTDSSVLGQIVLIAVAGIYLFSMVWLYAQVPWLALAGTVVAMLIVVYGFYQRLREVDRHSK